MFGFIVGKNRQGSHQYALPVEYALLRSGKKAYSCSLNVLKTLAYLLGSNIKTEVLKQSSFYKHII